MTPSPKKPGVAFWIIVATLAVLVLYPLSIGPACRLLVRTHPGDTFHWTWKAYRKVYAPIIWVYSHGPQPFHDALDWYCGTKT